MRRFSLEGSLWRRLARFGARGPAWFSRYAPPLIGLAICALSPKHRRAIAMNLRRVRGRRGKLRDSADVARTFATYASCLTEVLAGESSGRPPADAVVSGNEHVDDALADGHGIIFATAHTAGWEAVGTALHAHRGLRVMIAAAAERDPASRAIQDDARRARGMLVTHVGDDPLSGLPLLRHLRGGGVVALQIDRVPHGLRGRTVTLFGGPGRVPEGPIRLAMLTGAPILPIFTARMGYRRYQVVASAPIRVARHADDSDLDDAAQKIACALEGFVRAHPTQWFHFREH